MAQPMIQLNDDLHLDRRHKEILAKLRKTYGNTTQILVSNEELCELAAVCAKFPRYTDPEKARAELHSAAIDEVADVLIVLDHIINIFGLREGEIRARITGKIDRIVRWLAKSDSQEQTTVDREVREEVNHKPDEKGQENPTEHPEKGTAEAHCVGCSYVGEFQQLKIGGRCHLCSTHDWSLFESKEAPGVGRGHRVPAKSTHESGKTLTWEEFVLLQIRAQRRGLLFPDEVYLIIKANRAGAAAFNFQDEEGYGLCWEAVWR